MTSPTKHSPAPWTTKYDPSTHRFEINADHAGQCVAFIHVPPAVGYENRQANAHLIAAAPELYEALEGVRFGIDAEYKRSGCLVAKDELATIDAALAKARGGQQ